MLLEPSLPKLPAICFSYYIDVDVYLFVPMPNDITRQFFMLQCFGFDDIYRGRGRGGVFDILVNLPLGPQCIVV